ncbi:MAG: phosphate acetyltransferase [Epsilonproteobacteria bacterium]|nr:phosphate acetyltransferase [Campylobacterota bacterium]
MKIKSLYIAAGEKNAGALFVTMGMMEILKRNLHRVAFFRPVIYKKDVIDGDISFILGRYNLDMRYEDTFFCDIEYAESMIAAHKTNELINQIITHFKRVEKEYDFVLCEGIRKSFLSNNISFDLNLKIAQNIGASYVNVINAKEKSAQEVYESIMIESENSFCEECAHFATFVNRLDDAKEQELKERLATYKGSLLFMLKEIEELNLITIEDIIETLGAKPLLLGTQDHTRVVRHVKVAALSLNNFLDHIEEDDLIIVPADRSEIILGVLGALYSNVYPNISGILFPLGMNAHPNIVKLINGLDGFTVPVLALESDTYESAKAVSKVHARLRVSSARKIALSMGLFNSSVDTKLIEQKIESVSSDVLTPMMFQYRLFEMARSNKKRIVLPESGDERILRAAEIVLRREVAEIILLGNERELKERYLRMGLDLSRAIIVDPSDEGLLEEFTEKFYEMRKNKGLTRQVAHDAMIHVNYFGTMMVELGMADGMVSGATHSTADTIRPALQIIKTKPNISIVSSIFFMCLKTKVLVYGDCAINQDPSASELADIAIASAKSAAAFGIVPKVALLSYSTGESGHGSEVDKVREATHLVHQRAPELLAEGPIQYDAAIDKEVASQKLPHSKVAGEASVFIFPDLNTGNNTYKAVQRSSDAVAIGPVLQGLRKPINDLSRGCLIDDIVNTIAITAIQAQERA